MASTKRVADVLRSGPATLTSCQTVSQLREQKPDVGAVLLGGNYLGHLKMLMLARNLTDRSERPGDGRRYSLFLEDDSRLQPDFGRNLETTLRMQPPDTWDVLHLTGGGTPVALRPSLGNLSGLYRSALEHAKDHAMPAVPGCSTASDPYDASTCLLTGAGYLGR